MTTKLNTLLLSPCVVIAASLLNEIGKGMIVDRTGLLKTNAKEFIETCPAEQPASGYQAERS